MSGHMAAPWLVLLTTIINLFHIICIVLFEHLMVSSNIEFRHKQPHGKAHGLGCMTVRTSFPMWTSLASMFTYGRGNANTVSRHAISVSAIDCCSAADMWCRLPLHVVSGSSTRIESAHASIFVTIVESPHSYSVFRGTCSVWVFSSGDLKISKQPSVASASLKVLKDRIQPSGQTFFFPFLGKGWGTLAQKAHLCLDQFTLIVLFFNHQIW